jgi:surfactin synthase thioesterase subunit
VKLLDGGHFVLEEAADTIVAEMRALADRVKAQVYA